VGVEGRAQQLAGSVKGCRDGL